MRGVIIAGTHSGCGKTTITLGIMAALRKQGLKVQPFKTGPDFIDAGLHRLAAGRVSRNLDHWMCGRDYVVRCFQKHAATADISVIEGVMGMYDGDFNTASLSTLLQVPVVLVVDAYGMAESAGAIVRGFAEFGKTNPPTPPLTKGGKGGSVAGVIFNRVASVSHFKRLKDSVQDVPVLGYLPRELNFEIPHRHLGLATAEEGPLSDENTARLADTVLKYIDIEKLLSPDAFPPIQGEGQGGDGVSKTVDSPLTHPHPNTLPPMHSSGACSEGEGKRRIRIAVAYDRAFCFYYEDNLDLLTEAGAEIVRFSPLADRAIPEGVDAVYIGGGYPELHAQALAGNTSMLASVKAWSDSARPLYAECGGLMYLSRGIRDFDGRSYAMAGIFPFETRMLKKAKLAYREIVLNEDCILGTGEEQLRGHEFHYSEIVDQPTNDEGPRTEPCEGRLCTEDCTEIYSVRDKTGASVQSEGFRIGNTLASYIHVHFGSNANSAERFLRFTRQDRSRKSVPPIGQ